MGVLDIILLPFRVIGGILSFLSIIALFVGVVGLIYGLISGNPDAVVFTLLLIVIGSVGLIIGRILTGGEKRSVEPYRETGPPPSWELQQRQQEYQRQQWELQRQQQQRRQQEFLEQQRKRMQRH